MKFLSPIVLKEKNWKPIEKEINRLFWEVMFSPIAAALEAKPAEIKNAKAPLYIRRSVLNADDLIAWAKSQGFKSTLAADDFHVTICHSRAGVEGKDIEKAKGKIIIASKAARRIAPLGDKGAVVMFFESSILEARWKQLIEKHGASWDYDSYHPHITITYDPGDIDLAKVQPYDGPLILGPEIHQRLISGWRKKISEILNAQSSPLDRAIKQGTVYFEDGLFRGEFNAGISRDLRALGAKFNPKSKTWSYAGTLPAEISTALALADMRYSGLKRRLISVLDGIDLDKIASLSRTKELFGIQIDALDEEYKKAVNSITIPPRLTAGMKKVLAEEWGENLDLYIKKWAEENILKLRQQVQANAFAGRRAKAMIQGIQRDFGVSKNKAKFLARQETSLLVSKFREQRFKQVGSQRYRWAGAMDERERPDHKMLEGQIFSWDDPPVVDRKTGRRAHPGEDFGCRCVAVPIID